MRFTVCFTRYMNRWFHGFNAGSWVYGYFYCSDVPAHFCAEIRQRFMSALSTILLGLTGLDEACTLQIENTRL